MPKATGRVPDPDARVPGPQSHQQIIESLHQYAAEGLSEVMLWLDPNTLASIEELGGLLAELDR